ncbi:lipase/AP-1 adaptor complex binding protein Mil1 [Schizosaccharomyces osmophilus]|uniref:Lipase/AP-1 adaptor complex binding protein Mil1 n=1 Tax=Schizosaccharomyces osmophilus TaxID=2545709 RepID=A0AAF0AWU0_9SCHI|nr:lipase/AP-1 adaptor complex binding protein Mil1 [Schizosaccharomyces osmophilus]WBW73385.1 lipase/AP-1 adaptor complex binding protein Mil1 [Schizosaccharomyces osmophilus]
MAEKQLISLFDDEYCTKYTILIASTLGRMKETRDSSFYENEHQLSEEERKEWELFHEKYDEWAITVVKRTGNALDPSTPKDAAEVKKFKSFSEAEKGECFVKCLLLLLISLEDYSSNSRQLLYLISKELNQPEEVPHKAEFITSSMLIETFEKIESNEKWYELSKSQQLRKRITMGLAGITGGALIGITGGLAAPFVVSGLGVLFAGLGLGTVVGASYLGAVITSAPMITALFGGFGAKMSMNQVHEISRGIRDFEFIPLDVSSNLSMTIGVAGWLESPQDAADTWYPLTFGDKSYYWGDLYALKFEVQAFVDLGKVISRILFTTGLGWVQDEVLKRTILAPLSAALWPLGLLRIGNILGNSWRVVFNLSIKAGEALANGLCMRAQGKRPVTLIGFSLGSRTIFECLLKLADRGEIGIVENVILMGTPASTDPKLWRKMRSVVSGRFVNVYSKNDYVLQLVYKTNSIQAHAAGLEPIAVNSSCVENFNVGDLIEGHLQYRWLLPKILKERLGYSHISDKMIDELQIQEKTFEQSQRELFNEDTKEQEVIFDASETSE